MAIAPEASRYPRQIRVASPHTAVFTALRFATPALVVTPLSKAAMITRYLAFSVVLGITRPETHR